MRVIDRGLPRGRGLHAINAIPGGSRILSVPLDCCLTAEMARRVLGEKVSAEFEKIRNGKGFKAVGEVDDVALLALLVLFAGMDLPLKKSDYCDSRTHELLLLYIPTLPREIQGGFLKDSVALAKVEALWGRVRPIVDANREIFTSDIAGYTSAFLWAYSCVLSRSMSFSLPSGQMLAMVPIADMINHHPSPANTQYHLFATEERTISVYARWDYDAGEEISINYGKGIGEGTLHYGFVVQ